MFIQQCGTCAICLRMASVTLRVDDPHKNGTARHLVCNACIAGHDSYEEEPDVAWPVAGFRDRGRGADDG
jgi:hypothetical protein